MTPALVLFLSGMLATAYIAIAGFFLHYWRQTRDRLFLSFAVAFGIFAVQRALLVSEFALVENTTGAYMLRLLGFLIIVYAIIAKNRERPS